MASQAAKKGCVGSPSFDPDERVCDAPAREEALAHLGKNEFADAISSWFELPRSDKYVYHAITSVFLAQVQDIVRRGGGNGLHDWYRDEFGQPLPPPSQADVEAYISIFLSTTATAASLKGFAANAKKGSVRASVAAHLQATRYLHPGLASRLTIPKAKKPPPNPYFDFWAWSARNLEWCGPARPESERGGTRSHGVLPIFMHHFGCVVPSYESLEVLRVVADGRRVADVGSGNGYWTFMLRQHGLDVVAVDNAQSEWRVNWIGDTVVSDGVKWLSRKEKQGGKDMVLLMVYPIVGGSVAGGVEGGFTRNLLAAFRGDTVAVVGTQNHNGYTGFKGMTMAEYMEREQPDWVRVVQIPLPSFAGKDEALFVFQRGGRAPLKQEIPKQS